MAPFSGIDYNHLKTVVGFDFWRVGADQLSSYLILDSPYALIRIGSHLTI